MGLSLVTTAILSLSLVELRWGSYDHCKMNPFHAFAGIQFDRLADRRDDREWMAQLDIEKIQVIPVWRGRVLVDSINDLPRMSSINRYSATVGNQDGLIFLGEFRDQIFFAIDISDHDDPAVRAPGQFHDLRAVSGLLHRDELGLLGYARALTHWQRTHQFCGKCGARNQIVKAGHVMECSNANCKQQNFPRLDPAVIVLVNDGDRVLLGRQTQFSPGRYSTIAGFVEWAESIEEAVMREVREETGVIVNEAQYHSSQPWPFPSSLMLGFIAQATTTEVTLHDGELEDARWFSRKDIAAGALSLPPTLSISFALIEHWYNQGSPCALRDEPGARIDTPAQVFKPS